MCVFDGDTEACPKLVAELRTQFLRRLPDNERLRVLKGKAERSMALVERHDFELRMKSSAKFIFSILMPKQKGLYFYRWVGRARYFKHKRLSMEKAKRHHREQHMIAYLRYWRDWAKFPLKKVRHFGVGF